LLPTVCFLSWYVGTKCILPCFSGLLSDDLPSPSIPSLHFPPPRYVLCSLCRKAEKHGKNGGGKSLSSGRSSRAYARDQEHSSDASLSGDTETDITDTGALSTTVKKRKRPSSIPSPLCSCKVMCRSGSQTMEGQDRVMGNSIVRVNCELAVPPLLAALSRVS